ncbi:hypothetical protein K439DRAFT_23435 [Ramaria rubella]|nr:hypothetical protein K439DRAFT_23435 [Ramaria rubella]
MNTRKPPHCRTCHKPLKGHKRGICELPEVPSPSKSPVSSRSASAKTRKSAPLPVQALPSLSSQSSQILNDLLRANSYSAPPLQVPEIKRNNPRGASEELVPNAEEAIPWVPTQTNILFSSKRQAASKKIVKLEDSPPRTSQASFNVSSADVAIQSFLEGMAKNPQHPPATIFSFPPDDVLSLQNYVKGCGLHMHILSLPKDEWVLVVIGRDADAIAKLLEDSEKLAGGLRRPDKFKVSEFDLGISHIVVGAIGVLATWAGLAYA